MKREISVVAVAAALAVASAACGNDDDTSDTDGAPSATADTTADGIDPVATGADTDTDDATGDGDTTAACESTVEGSRLTFGAYLSTGQLDPTLVPGGLVGGTEIAALYDVLFTYDYDAGEVRPHLAESITSNDDFTEFTLTMREGIAYSDGTPLDAQMVADNFDRFFADDATAPHAGYLGFISETRVEDDLVLEISMSRPWVEFPAFLAEQPGMIVNTNVVGGDLYAFAADPPDAAGVGPYVLERSAPGEEIVLTARDDYWGGPVCVETLRIVSIPGADGTYQAFRNDELDVAYLRDPVTIAETVAKGEESAFVSFDGGAMMFVNHAEGYAADDDRLREAMWLAIDPDIVNERAFQGQLSTSMSLVHHDSLFGSAAPATVEHDPGRARELVDEATADGVDASLTIRATTDTDNSDMALALQGLLAAVGFDVTITQAPTNEHITAVLERNFDAAMWALTIDPSQVASRLHSSLHSDGLNNQGSYASEEMDAALDEAMSAGSEAKAAAVDAVNDLYVQDYVSPILANNLEGIIWQPHVDGVVVAPTNIFLFHDAVVTTS